MVGRDRNDSLRNKRQEHIKKAEDIRIDNDAVISMHIEQAKTLRILERINRKPNRWGC